MRNKKSADPARRDKADVTRKTRNSPKPHLPRPLPPERKNWPGITPPGPPGTALVRAGHPGNAKSAAPRLRHAPAGAARRELSKSVEFLKIGSLHQMLWLRDLDAVYRVHCDTSYPGSCYINEVRTGKPRMELSGSLLYWSITSYY